MPNLGQIRLLELRAHHLDRDVRGDRARATWPPVNGGGLLGLRHLARGDPLLDLCPEVAPKGPGRNRVHLDVRLDPGDNADAVAREIGERGGRELHYDWGDLPWRHFADPSGNELCMLPSR